MLNPEKILTDQSQSYDGMTAISETGSLVAISKNNGDIEFLTRSGTAGRVDVPTTRSITHMYISEDGPRGVVGSIDGDIVMGFNSSETWGYKFEGLWDIEPVHNFGGACICTRPRVGTGSVKYVDGGEKVWDKSLDNATGITVAASQDASQIAVGMGQYYLDEEPLKRFGAPGIAFYEWGDEEWSKETADDAIGLILDSVNDRIITGLDDGSIAGYRLTGEVLSKEDGIYKVTDELWNEEYKGGFLSVSGDQTSIVSHILGVLRCFDTRGNLQWKADIEEMSMNEESVQIDRTGDRVLITTMDEHAYLIERGDLIWDKPYPGGPVRGSLSSDGKSWCIADETLDTQSTTIHVYQDSEHEG